jgi:hypothetical protein
MNHVPNFVDIQLGYRQLHYPFTFLKQDTPIKLYEERS